MYYRKRRTSRREMLVNESLNAEKRANDAIAGLNAGAQYVEKQASLPTFAGVISDFFASFGITDPCRYVDENRAKIEGELAALEDAKAELSNEKKEVSRRLKGFGTLTGTVGAGSLAAFYLKRYVSRDPALPTGGSPQRYEQVPADPTSRPLLSLDTVSSQDTDITDGSQLAGLDLNPEPIKFDRELNVIEPEPTYTRHTRTTSTYYSSASVDGKPISYKVINDMAKELGIKPDGPGSSYMGVSPAQVPEILQAWQEKHPTRYPPGMKRSHTYRAVKPVKGGYPARVTRYLQKDFWLHLGIAMAIVTLLIFVYRFMLSKAPGALCTIKEFFTGIKDAISSGIGAVWSVIKSIASSIGGFMSRIWSGMGFGGNEKVSVTEMKNNIMYSRRLNESAWVCSIQVRNIL